jgi:hypothetical protein
MNRLIIADEAMQKKLGNADQPAMICAPDGTVIGYFTPTTPPQKLLLEPQISIEELERRIADKTSPTYTTEEIIAYLRSLPREQ